MSADPTSHGPPSITLYCRHRDAAVKVFPRPTGTDKVVTTSGWRVDPIPPSIPRPAVWSAHACPTSPEIALYPGTSRDRRAPETAPPDSFRPWPPPPRSWTAMTGGGVTFGAFGCASRPRPVSAPSSFVPVTGPPVLRIPVPPRRGYWGNQVRPGCCRQPLPPSTVFYRDSNRNPRHTASPRRPAHQ